jgi:hypothetical protein
MYSINQDESINESFVDREFYRDNSGLFEPLSQTDWEKLKTSVGIPNNPAGIWLGYLKKSVL